jgi:hypothetical protein
MFEKAAEIGLIGAKGGSGVRNRLLPISASAAVPRLHLQSGDKNHISAHHDDRFPDDPGLSISVATLFYARPDFDSEEVWESEAVNFGTNR